MTAPKKPSPVVLCILDGWGDRSDGDDNAIALANTPNWDRLGGSCPRSRLNASAGEVGLPEGQMGNSEVGHMNLGAGRVVMQDLPRIDSAFRDGVVSDEPPFAAFAEALKKSGGTCHLMGLLSPGGVHAHQGQMASLAHLLAERGIPVAVHAFLDGRDMPPKSAASCLERFEARIAGCDNVGIATIVGRYYAMDRDNRWDRVQKAYDLIVDGQGEAFPFASEAIEAAYVNGQSDEFVLPAAIGGYGGAKDGDGILMANFRADRAREILAALTSPGFDGFERARVVDFAARLGMVEYSKSLNEQFEVMFPPETLNNVIGEVIADLGLRQLRIAETEKYAHVTFFMNGGREEPFDGEDRILVPSPNVATYDLQPAMSAPELTDKLCAAITGGPYDLIIANYANGDMVGHTGVLSAAIEAVEVLDESLGRLEKAVVDAGGTMLVTADHGNCEQMSDEAGGAHTAHTLNVVPAILVNPPEWVSGLHAGRLSDVAPTLLRLMDIPQPREMTGQSLIEESGARAAAQ
ncbi:MAG: 2,3-bisphosphoglycerate-independent phosphoglycerate mutase [Rhodospirillales bacterium]